jgi:hypothetical protein
MSVAPFSGHGSFGNGATLVGILCASLIGCGGRDFPTDLATAEPNQESAAPPARAPALVTIEPGVRDAAASAAPANIASPVVVRRQPLSLEVREGSVAQFSVEAEGSHALTYQWLRDGEPVAGETGTVFQFSVTSDDDLSRISVLITVEHGSVLSKSALLRVRKT